MGNSKKNQCSVVKKNGDKCKKTVFLFFYCKKHWGEKVFNKKALFLYFVLAIGFVWNNYSTIKEIINDIEDASRPEPNYWIREQDGNIGGILFDKTKLNPNEYITIKLGRNTGIGAYSNFKRDNFCTFGMESRLEKICVLKLRIDDEDRILFSMDAFDVDGKLVAKIMDSKFIVNKDNSLTWNRDEKGIEIIDNNGHVVLSLDYIYPSTFSIQGFLSHPSDPLLHHIMSDYGGTKENIENREERLKYISDIVPRFEYYDKDSFGKRASSK